MIRTPADHMLLPGVPEENMLTGSRHDDVSCLCQKFEEKKVSSNETRQKTSLDEMLVVLKRNILARPGPDFRLSCSGRKWREGTRKRVLGHRKQGLLGQFRAMSMFRVRMLVNLVSSVATSSLELSRTSPASQLTHVTLCSLRCFSWLCHRRSLDVTASLLANPACVVVIFEY